jgi:hypothetical protein
MLRTWRLSRSWGNCYHSCKIAVLNSSIFWHFGLRWLIFRPIKSHTCTIGFMSGDIAGHGIVWTASCCRKCYMKYIVKKLQWPNTFCTSLYRRGNQKYQRRTDDTLAKEKRANNDLKSTTQKSKQFLLHYHLPITTQQFMRSIHLYNSYRYIHDSHHALIDLSGITIASENLIC